MHRLIPICAAALVFLPISSARAQSDTLSFEPDGRQSCARSLARAIPAGSEDLHAFDHACTQHDLAIEKMQMDALTRSMQTATPEQRLAFNALIVTFTSFRELHISNETCPQAQACVEQQQHELAVTNNDFLKLARALPAEGIPTYSAMDLEGLDADLNAAYIDRYTLLSSSCPAPATVDTCAPMAGLRDTERAWIRYRDAWITFGTLRYPQVTADQWTGYLTRERTRQVKAA